MAKIKGIVRVKGGAGSGNWGHTGRPGVVGGSGGGAGVSGRSPGKNDLYFNAFEEKLSAFDESTQLTEPEMRKTLDRLWQGALEVAEAKGWDAIGSPKDYSTPRAAEKYGHITRQIKMSMSHQNTPPGYAKLLALVQTKDPARDGVTVNMKLSTMRG